MLYFVLLSYSSDTNGQKFFVLLFRLTLMIRSHLPGIFSHCLLSSPRPLIDDRYPCQRRIIIRISKVDIKKSIRGWQCGHCPLAHSYWWILCALPLLPVKGFHFLQTFSMQTRSRIFNLRQTQINHQKSQKRSVLSSIVLLCRSKGYLLPLQHLLLMLNAKTSPFFQVLEPLVIV